MSSNFPQPQELTKTSAILPGRRLATSLAGQGSGGAAKVSALNLDRKLFSVFHDSQEMIRYGSVKQRPYAFQDDALVLVDDIDHLRLTVAKKEIVMKTMQVLSGPYRS